MLDEYNSYSQEMMSRKNEIESSDFKKGQNYVDISEGEINLVTDGNSDENSDIIFKIMPKLSL